MKANPDFLICITDSCCAARRGDFFLRDWGAETVACASPTLRHDMCVWAACVFGDTGDGQIRLDTVDAAQPRPFVRRMWFICEVWGGCGAALGRVMGEGTDWQWQWGGNGSEWGGMAPVAGQSSPVQIHGEMNSSLHLTCTGVLFFFLFFHPHRARNRGYL